MGEYLIRVPDAGEGIAEVELVEWHVKPGDPVQEDMILAAVMTDKATVEIPSPVSGTVKWLGGDIGDMLAVGADLARLEVVGAGNVAEAKSAADESPLTEPAPEVEPPAAPARAAGEEKKPAPPPPPTRPMPRAGEGPAPRSAGGLPRPLGEKPLAAPSVRRRASDAGIDLRRVRGTGPAGRIGHEDLDAYIRGAEETQPAGGRAPNTQVEEIRVIGLRRRIAERMAEAKRRVPHFSYVEEVDVTALEDLRAALNAGDAGRPRLTLLPFLVQAIVRAVADFPGINAQYDDEGDVIRRYGAVHAGIATQTPGGLTVPVVRHAEALDLWEIAAEIRRLADAARDGTATREELSGSTITITSLGPLGGIVSTPVINRPEVAIVGVNKIAIRPVWQNGGFVPRKIMNLSSSFDHRVVDGFDAASFIQKIRGYLETPATLFMEQ